MYNCQQKVTALSVDDLILVRQPWLVACNSTLWGIFQAPLCRWLLLL